MSAFKPMVCSTGYAVILTLTVVGLCVGACLVSFFFFFLILFKVCFQEEYGYSVTVSELRNFLTFFAGN